MHGLYLESVILPVAIRGQPTLIMQADDERPRQRTSEHEENIASPVLGNVALADHSFLLELGMGPFVWAQFSILDIFPSLHAF